MKVDAVGPATADPYICRAKGRRQFPQTGVTKVNGRTILEKIRVQSSDGCSWLQRWLWIVRSFRLTAIRLPEPSASDLHHFDIVRLETLVNLSENIHLARINRHNLARDSDVYPCGGE